MINAFKAYDIRGIYSKDFNRDDVYKIGYHLPLLLNTNKVLTGRDARLSSDEIFHFLSLGITDNGCDVYNAGLCTTPMVYYATARNKFNASVQITASHNPAEYNGMKISGTGALPVGFNNGLDKLLEMALTREVKPAKIKGKIYDYHILDDYLKFLQSFVQDYSGLNIAVDCSNGMAGLFIKGLLGNKPHYLFDWLDGRFPNHEPNPLVEENVSALKMEVLKNHCDLGIIFDGDADRVMFVDEKGDFVPPDMIIGLLAHYFLEKEKSPVLIDIRSSRAVKEYIEKLGGEVHMWRVGRAFATPKLKEINGVFGGELAGHYYFRDFFYSDSGVMAALIVLNLLLKFKCDGKGFSEIISKISKYANSGEINFRVGQKQEAMDRLKGYFIKDDKLLQVLDFDGYRLDFENWWFNIRASNTEPYLRLVVEAENKALLGLKLAEIKTIIGQFS